MLHGTPNFPILKHIKANTTDGFSDYLSSTQVYRKIQADNL